MSVYSRMRYRCGSPASCIDFAGQRGFIEHTGEINWRHKLKEISALRFISSAQEVRWFNFHTGSSQFRSPEFADDVVDYLADTHQINGTTWLLALPATCLPT